MKHRHSFAQVKRKMNILLLALRDLLNCDRKKGEKQVATEIQVKINWLSPTTLPSVLIIVHLFLESGLIFQSIFFR